MGETECFLVELYARNGVKWKFVCENLKVSISLLTLGLYMLQWICWHQNADQIQLK